MSLSLTPEPNQEPKKLCVWFLLALLFVCFALSGCGLKDDLIMPDSAQQKMTAHTQLQTVATNTLGVSE